MHLSLAAFLGSAVGLSLGLLGGGGSILTVPLLVYALHVSARAAITTSLLIVGATALLGAWFHHRHGNVCGMTAVTFGSVGILAAYGGSKLSRQFDESVLLILFALIMLAASGAMWRGRGHLEQVKSESDPFGLSASEHRCHSKASEPCCHSERSEESRFDKRFFAPLRMTNPKVLKVLLSGVGVGFLTGFLGVGGGFLIVPALVLFAGLPMPEAVGTSLFIIAMNCAAGFVGHLQNLNVNGTVAAVFTAGAIGGSFVGERLASRLSPVRLQKAFAVFIALVAAFLLVKNLAGLGK
jgi:hypothetical protein